MHHAYRCTRNLLALAAGIVLLLAPPVRADRQGPAREPQPEPPARAPRTVAQFRQVPQPPPVQKTVQRTTPATSEDKGSLVTEVAGAATPTEHERAKLDAAREAVARAKAAGTRELRLPVAAKAELSPEAIEARKWQDLILRLATPRSLEQNEEAMPWLVSGPRQKTGPEAVTPAERAKAEAARTRGPSGPEAVTPAPAAAPARREGGR